MLTEANLTVQGLEKLSHIEMHRQAFGTEFKPQEIGELRREIKSGQPGSNYHLLLLDLPPFLSLCLSLDTKLPF